MDENQVIEFITQKLEDLKVKNIVLLNVKGKSTITDYMIISTGTSTRHVASVAQHLIEQAKNEGILVLGSEGRADANWIVVDFNSVIVHIMQEDSRLLYELEKLWS